VYRRAVGTLEFDIIRGDQRNLAPPAVVVVGERSDPAVLDGDEFAGLIGRPVNSNDPAIAGNVKFRNDAVGARQSLDVSILEPLARKQLVPVVLEQKIDPAAVRGPMRVDRQAIEGCRWQLRAAAAGSTDCQLYEPEPGVLWVAAAHVSQPPSIRTESGRPISASPDGIILHLRRVGELSGRAAGPWVDEIKVPVVVSVGLSARLRQIYDRRSVWRPCGLNFVRQAMGELRNCAAVEVEEI